MKFTRWGLGAALAVAGALFTVLETLPGLVALKGSGKPMLAYGHVLGLLCSLAVTMLGLLLIFAPDSFRED